MLLSHKFRFSMIAVLMMLALAFVVSCDDDDDNQPSTGTLTGTVIFHGDWPDSGTVQLSIFENWNISAGNCSWCVNAAGGPPAYHTDASFFQDPDPTNSSDADTLTFEITGITLGTYNSIVTGWRAPEVTDIVCDEPIIGMYGGDPLADDSLPTAVTFSEGSATQTITMHTYFDHFLPVPGCDDRGRIEGTISFAGMPWPNESVLVMLTAVPASPWQPVMQQPVGYDFPTEADPTFRFLPQFGIYYLSIWTNAQPPSPTKWYGSYGMLIATNDAQPDPIVIDMDDPSSVGLAISGFSPAPHYISGNVNFTGTRPEVGLLVLLSTFPYSPEHAPQGPPTAYFPITDDAETLYAFTGIQEGTYYASLWSNTPPPGVPTFFGAYGYVSGSDTDPDPVVIDGTTNYGRTGINISN